MKKLRSQLFIFRPSQARLSFDTVKIVIVDLDWDDDELSS